MDPTAVPVPVTPEDHRPRDRERCRDPYDKEHLEHIFAIMQRAEESEWVTMLEGSDVRVQRSDFERPFLWHRACAEAEDVPVEVVTRIVSAAEQKPFSPFIKSEEEHTELRPPDPGDPDGLGRVVVKDHSAVFFGFHVEERLIYATRRMPDGTGLFIKVPVDFINGRWTTRRWEEKFIPLVAFRSEVTARGSRFTGYYKERPTVGFLPFLPTSILRQVIVRICAKVMLQFRRTHVAEWQAAAVRARRPARPLVFASGSASAPLHLSCPTFSLAATADSPASSPFVVHAWSARVHIHVPSPDSSPEPESGAAYPSTKPPPPPSRDTNDLFLDLIGVEEPPAARGERRDPSARTFQISNSQLVKTETYTETPGYRSVVGEAMRASLDLSIHMEALSLGVAPPAPPPGAPPAPAAGPAPDAQPGKARARPRPEEEAAGERPACVLKKDEPGEEPPQPPAKPKRDPSHRKPRPPPQPYKPPRPILSMPGAPGPPTPAGKHIPRRRARKSSQPKPAPAYPLQPTAAGLPAGYYITYDGTAPRGPAFALSPATFPAAPLGSVCVVPSTLQL